jgi:hypothetical protein
MDEEQLAGGLANYGKVTRRGDTVRRPAPPHAAALHTYLQALADAGFDGAPRPLKLYDDGFEELTFIAGDVAVPPYPEWSRSDEALASIGRLLRRMHDAAAKVPIPDADWPTEFIDPAGGPILCHNDVCEENVVFQNGEATAFIDFDFAAPGRPLWDLGCTAFHWVPMIPPKTPAVDGIGKAELKVAQRLRLLADAYGLDDDGRREVLDLFPQIVATEIRFNHGRVAAGDPVFIQMEAELDPRRWERILAWHAENRESFLAALHDDASTTQ